MKLLLEQLGKKVFVQEDVITIQTDPAFMGDDAPVEAPYDLVRKMRASICVLGPLLAKRKRAKVSLPGGCVIGPRPVDLHIKALSALGAQIEVIHGFVTAEAPNLKGCDFVLEGKFGSSVLGTANMMMCAVLAEGKTIIRSAACEPEVKDLASFLKSMGANIKGEGTKVIEIEGVKILKGAEHRVIADRIETGTYLLAAAVAGGEIKLTGVISEHVMALIYALKQAGQDCLVQKDSITIKGNKVFSPVSIETIPYPGFATDLQAQMCALLCFAKGTSVITEKIYPDRFMYISELNRMGANIVFDAGKAIVKGIDKLFGADVMASDLRASAALVIAGLAAEGITKISRVYHLDRGYEKLEAKLAAVGANISRISEQEESPLVMQEELVN